VVEDSGMSAESDEAVNRMSKFANRESRNHDTPEDIASRSRHPRDEVNPDHPVHTIYAGVKVPPGQMQIKNLDGLDEDDLFILKSIPMAERQAWVDKRIKDKRRQHEEDVRLEARVKAEEEAKIADAKAAKAEDARKAAAEAARTHRLGPITIKTKSGGATDVKIGRALGLVPSEAEKKAYAESRGRARAYHEQGVGIAGKRLEVNQREANSAIAQASVPTDAIRYIKNPVGGTIIATYKEQPGYRKQRAALRELYARGEIDDPTFWRAVEQLNDIWQKKVLDAWGLGDIQVRLRA
jgi:hypothetical protein